MKALHAAIAAAVGLALAVASAQQVVPRWRPGEPPAEPVRPQSRAGRAQRIDVESLLDGLRARLAADEAQACEIVQAAIAACDGSPALVARIFETAATEVPDQLRLLSQCALAAAPDALAEIQEVVAMLDPNAGDATAGAKASPAKAGTGKEPIAPAAARLPDALEREGWFEVVEATTVSWLRYARELREAPAQLEVESAKGGKAGLARKTPPAPRARQPAPAAAARKPNVVLILADDLGCGDLGCFGQQRIRTPNLDRLAHRGIRLTRHYAGAPSDEGSRSVLLTGRHTGRPQGSGATLPEVFRRAGYRTAAIGKWAVATQPRDPSPADWGFDSFFGSDTRVMTHSYYPARLLADDRWIEVNRFPVPAHAPPCGAPADAGQWVSGTYAPDLFVDRALQFIAANRERPFLLYLACPEPHAPLHPPQDWVDEYPPEWDQQPYRGDNSYLPHPRPRAAYAAHVSDLDRHVGAVLGALSRNGLADDTLVVFTSDHGVAARGNPHCPFHVGGVDAAFFASAAGLRGTQGTLHEGGLRVPTIVALPRRARAGTTAEMPSYAADWLPTLCAAAGIDPPPDLDGENLWPALTGDARPARQRPMLWADARHGGQVAVRLGRFKVLRQHLGTPEPGAWEVYDLDHDPAETTNLAAARPDLTVHAEAVLRREVTTVQPALAAVRLDRPGATRAAARR